MKDLVTEVWKDIEGYEGLYQVSNLGRVKSIKRNNGRYRGEYDIIMKIQHSHDGYSRIGLCNGKKQKFYFVHRLVAEAFVPNVNNLPQINHIDENKNNNIYTNLEWCTNKYNVNYGERNKIAAMHISKKVRQYTIAGEFIKEWDSITTAAHTLHCDISSITACCRGRKKTCHNSRWIYSHYIE